MATRAKIREEEAFIVYAKYNVAKIMKGEKGILDFINFTVIIAIQTSLVILMTVAVWIFVFIFHKLH